jgi:prolyl oligopeptidase
MYLTYKAGIKLNGNNPVILYGYGGFGIKMVPFFNAANIIFLQNGGVLAVPCIRGGGDLPGWHEQGRRLKRQNSFDDFISAAEYLVANKYSSPEKMAAMGGSNGGLLVAAVMLQRPDLFKVVVAMAGVLDMMRYHLYNIGYAWRDEYGSVKDSADFKNLLRYSPVQNVKQGINYPATLLVAGDNDDRVDPFHSFKFLAALQANAAEKNPCILYYEKQAGHVISRDVEKTENTEAFIYAFIYKYLGIENKISYDKPSW